MQDFDLAAINPADTITAKAIQIYDKSNEAWWRLDKDNGGWEYWDSRFGFVCAVFDQHGNKIDSMSSDCAEGNQDYHDREDELLLSARTKAKQLFQLHAEYPLVTSTIERAGAHKVKPGAILVHINKRPCAVVGAGLPSHIDHIVSTRASMRVPGVSTAWKNDMWCEYHKKIPHLKVVLRHLVEP